MESGLLLSRKTCGALGIFLALAVTAGWGQVWAQCVTPPSGMTAWYPLNEPPGASLVLDVATLVNPSTTPNPGIPKSSTGGSTTISAIPSAPPAGPVPTTAPPLNTPGMVQNALYFYGPYVEVQDQTDLRFGTGQFTIDTWIRDVVGYQAGFVRPIVDKIGITAFSVGSQTGTGTGYAFYVEDSRLKLAIGDGSIVVFQSNPIPPLNTGWHHVAVVAAGPLGPPTMVTFYLDGVQVPTATPTPTVPAGSNANALPLWIGKSRLSPLYYGFMGTALDELEIFKRALTAPEILSLYNASGSGKCRLTAVGLTLNQPSYTVGDTIVLSATITPGTQDNQVDGYINVMIPGGATYYLMPDMATWSPTPAPVVSNLAVVNFTGPIYSTIIPAGLPDGDYTFSAFGVTPGSDPANPTNLSSNKNFLDTNVGVIKPVINACKVTQVNEKASTFTIMSKGTSVTFSTAKLKAIPKVGEFIDIAYTENPVGTMEATTINTSKSNIY